MTVENSACRDSSFSKVRQEKESVSRLQAFMDANKHHAIFKDTRENAKAVVMRYYQAFLTFRDSQYIPCTKFKHVGQTIVKISEGMCHTIGTYDTMAHALGYKSYAELKNSAVLFGSESVYMNRRYDIPMSEYKLDIQFYGPSSVLKGLIDLCNDGFVDKFSVDCSVKFSTHKFAVFWNTLKRGEPIRAAYFNATVRRLFRSSGYVLSDICLQELLARIMGYRTHQDCVKASIVVNDEAHYPPARSPAWMARANVFIEALFAEREKEKLLEESNNVAPDEHIR